jgi:CheY-like chemotaxis protein
MTILIIEPDKLLSEQMQIMFSGMGHSCELTVDAVEAFYEIDQLAPDLIITELRVGKHGGYEFLYEINSYPDLMNTKIIIYTTEFLTVDILRSDGWNDLGILEYYYKPTTSIQQLANRIAKI